MVYLTAPAVSTLSEFATYRFIVSSSRDRFPSCLPYAKQYRLRVRTYLKYDTELSKFFLPTNAPSINHIYVESSQ